MLTELKVARAKPGKKAFKLTDGRGLYVLVLPDGAKRWRFNYRFGGKHKTLALGVYPEVKIPEARERLDDARRQLRDGLDPSAERRAAKRARRASATAGVTFRTIERKWWRTVAHTRSAATKEKHDSILEIHILPKIGDVPVRDIDAPMVLRLIERIDRGGRHETAHAVKRKIGQVLRYAIATGQAERDCTQDLRGAIAPVVVKHHPSLTKPADVGKLLVMMETDARGSEIIAIALRLLPLVFVRPGELRGAEWSEIDWKARLWRIPAPRMKMRLPHLVPLSRQAIKLLDRLRTLTGRGRYLFPKLSDPRIAMNENALNLALIRIGYSPADQTPHGFRTMASTLLNELGVNADWIEAQLAHRPPGVRAVYNQAKYLSDRVTMMQDYADYLDGLKAAALKRSTPQRSRSARR